MRFLVPALAGLALVAGCQPSTPAPSAAPPIVPAPTQESVTVDRVIDGDTLVVAGGRTIRVLGIDACDLGTPAGDRARAQATALVTSSAPQPVVLRAEPDVDRTPDGLLLRHVEVRGIDWGRQAVPYEHTGVASVGGVAAAGYVDELRSIDTQRSTSSPPLARACDEPPTTSSTTTTTTRETATDEGDPDRDYRPRRGSEDDSDGGDRSSGGSSSGGSSSGDGHPCGPGERDGDGDGLCGES